MSYRRVQMDDLDEREQIVLRALDDENDDAISTSDVLDAAEQYDYELNHSRQVTRVFDHLEELGLIVTRRGEAREPLAPPRLASLTPAGERAAERVTITPLDIDDLDDLEDELWSLREELDKLSGETPRRDDLTDVQQRAEEVNERVDEVANDVADLEKRIIEAEDRVEDTRETLADGLKSQNRILDDYDVRIEGLESQVDSHETRLERIEEVAREAWAWSVGSWVSDRRDPSEGEGRWPWQKVENIVNSFVGGQTPETLREWRDYEHEQIADSRTSAGDER